MLTRVSGENGALKHGATGTPDARALKEHGASEINGWSENGGPREENDPFGLFTFAGKSCMMSVLHESFCSKLNPRKTVT